MTDSLQPWKICQLQIAQFNNPQFPEFQHVRGEPFVIDICDEYDTEYSQWYWAIIVMF